MKRLNIVLDVIFKKVTKEDWDSVLLTGGDEGTGKSRLNLHITDGWYSRLYGKTLPSHADKIALTMNDFVTVLRDLDRFEMVNYDEGGDLSSLRMMNKFNYMVTKAYRVIRGDNLFTTIIIPDVFYLNPFFSTRRARGYLHVYKRGRFAYWNKNQLRRMIEVNKTKKHKSVWRVKPLFHDTFSDYKGPLLANYMKKKSEYVQKERQDLYNKIVVQDMDQVKELKYVYNCYKQIGAPKTAEIFEVTRQTIYNRIKEYRKISEGLSD